MKWSSICVFLVCEKDVRYLSDCDNYKGLIRGKAVMGLEYVATFFILIKK